MTFFVERWAPAAHRRFDTAVAEFRAAAAEDRPVAVEWWYVRVWVAHIERYLVRFWIEVHFGVLRLIAIRVTAWVGCHMGILGKRWALRVLTARIAKLRAEGF
jgi:hypothetical protein